MRLLTSEQAHFLDRVTIDEFKIQTSVLMKNAGQVIADQAKVMIAEFSNPKILIFCGKIHSVM